MNSDSPMRDPKLRTAWAGLMAVLLLSSQVFAQGLSAEQDRALHHVREGRFVVWPGLYAGQATVLREKAEFYLAAYQAEHQPHGYAVDLRWADRTRETLLQYDGLGDGAIWTGHYLAALSFQYRVAPNDGVLAAISDTLDALDALTRVSGKDGYVARYLGPASDPFYEPYYAQYGGAAFLRPGFGARAFPGVAPWEEFIWLGDSSRDTYDGIHFGCAAVWRNVEDGVIRAKVRALVERVGTALIRDNFLLLDERGNVELPNPSFYVAWLRLMLTVSPDTFREVRGYYAFGSWLFFVVDRWLGPGLRGGAEDRYYPNNLDMIRMFTLCTLEESPRRRAAYQEVLRRNYREHLSTHLNAHFAAIYLVATGIRDRAAIATLEGGLLDFPEDKFLHVPEPVADATTGEYARGALFVRQRSMRDFIWQRPPARLPDAELRPVAYPGVDYLLPYWMARSLQLAE